MNQQDRINYGLIGIKSAPKHKIVKEGQQDRKHSEADLHLQFCKWVKNNYPSLHFVRHEKEKARSPFMQNLMQVYNNFDGLPDFELLLPAGERIRIGKEGWNDIGVYEIEQLPSTHYYYGLYIEFKKPGEQWTLKDGITCKPQYAHQAQAHKNLWNIGRCAYFCNDLEDAQKLLVEYLSGNPRKQQDIIILENSVTLL